MKLIFKGIVQGVGFRPTIYRIAQDMNLKGYVLNKGSEVEVVIDKHKDAFINRVYKQLPSIAQITEITEEHDDHTFSDFQILHSEKGEKQSLIPPDVGVCQECLRELFDPQNKRYQFPFTNCTVCGARFSLITDVPYDRERTSMAAFTLCESCEQEYKNPLHRRYHAQTISCPTCGPSYRLYDKQKKDLGDKLAIKRFATQLDAGKIGVIKSWGGMHLCCKLEAIGRFREWYGRPQKAFAIMVRNLEAAATYGTITEEEKRVLLSKTKPIVLVKKIGAEQASPGLDTIGLFLPYTGLHYLLFSHLQTDALVMTSANIPGEAMITTDKEAFSIDADFYLLHNRSIPNRIDDSVLRLWKGHTFFLRKSRGYIPRPLAVMYDKTILSVGAGENITGALSHDNNVFVTQYIGNSKYYSTLTFLEESLRHLMKLAMTIPTLDAVVQDMHPAYDSRRVAKIFSDEFSVPLFEVQHHWAHAASLLVDNKLDESVVIAVDGLGYGLDGTFWGGEILDSRFTDFTRVGHLEPIPLLGGDQATKDPRRLVFAIFHKLGNEKFFSGDEAHILSTLMDSAPQSTSLGRVLDALSCYLNICTTRTYDGEPSMKLEPYLASGKQTYAFDVDVNGGVIGTIDIFRQLDEQIQRPLNDQEKADYAYSFVKAIVGTLSQLAIEQAGTTGINTIGLTGGVSYNIPITEMVEQEVHKAGLRFVVHNTVPNGDGGISIGQNAIIGHQLSA